MKRLLALALSAFLHLGATATPPGYDSECNCYRNVPYGTAQWQEPTLPPSDPPRTQVLDIWLPKAGSTPPYPVVFWGHPNGKTHTIAHNPNNPDSTYSRLIKQAINAGALFVSYEFRHPVINAPTTASPTSGLSPLHFDIRTAIDAFLTTWGPELQADASNVFVTGASRGAGLGVWTSLHGGFTSGAQVRAVWAYNPQTTFQCPETADLFIIPASVDGGVERDAFLAREECQVAGQFGSSIQTAGPQTTSPPMQVRYDGAFFGTPVTNAQFLIHHPDYGLALCSAYAQAGSEACIAKDLIEDSKAWSGMMTYFAQFRVVP